jgi:hypothetical protein
VIHFSVNVIHSQLAHTGGLQISLSKEYRTNLQNYDDKSQIWIKVFRGGPGTSTLLMTQVFYVLPASFPTEERSFKPVK